MENINHGWIALIHVWKTSTLYGLSWSMYGKHQPWMYRHSTCMEKIYHVPMLLFGVQMFFSVYRWCHSVYRCFFLCNDDVIRCTENFFCVPMMLVLFLITSFMYLILVFIQIKSLKSYAYSLILLCEPLREIVMG